MLTETTGRHFPECFASALSAQAPVTGRELELQFPECADTAGLGRSALSAGEFRLQFPEATASERQFTSEPDTVELWW